MHHHIALDLRIDLIQRLQRDFFAAQRRPRQFYKFAPEGVTRSHQEKSNQGNRADLSQHAQQTQCACPQMVFEIKFGFFNLYPLHTPTHGCGLVGFFRRLFKLGGRLLHGCQRVCLATLCANSIAQFLCCHG